MIAALAFEIAYAVSYNDNVVVVTLLPDAGRVLLRAEMDQGWEEHPLAAEVVTGQSVSVGLNVRAEGVQCTPSGAVRAGQFAAEDVIGRRASPGRRRISNTLAESPGEDQLHRG